MRYERKYLITHQTAKTVEQIIRYHPAGFKKIFPDRQVNNIYFDTIDYQTFQQNVSGNNQRKKFRLRWYGSNLHSIKSARFEIKIKHNELGDKKIIPFPDSCLNNLTSIYQKINKHTFLPTLLYPTLLNTYHRKYYGLANERFRITIDDRLCFYSIQGFKASSFAVNQKGVILEVKYEEADDKERDTIFSFLPYRLSKSSKYVNGIELTRLKNASY